MHRLVTGSAVAATLILTGCLDRQPLVPTPDHPGFFYGWDLGSSSDEFWVHFDPLWGPSPRFYGAGIEFTGYWGVNIVDQQDLVFAKNTPPTSGRSALQFGISGVPSIGVIRFDFPVRDISFNVRLYSDLRITCYDDRGSVVVDRMVAGSWSTGGVNLYPHPAEPPIPVPVQHVKLDGRGIWKCVTSAAGGILDDLRYRRDRNDLKLSCAGDLGENRVTRGEVIACTPKTEPEGGEIEIETWSFTGTDSHGEPYRFPEEMDGPLTDSIWRGRMVLSGTVSGRASVNGGEPQEVSLQVTVQARPWENHPVRANVRKVAWEAFSASRRPPPYPRGVRDLGRTTFIVRPLPLTLHVIGEIDDFGPNHYLLYLKEIPVELDFPVLVHPEMETRGEFWRHQSAGAPAFERDASCVRTQFDRYVQLILAHEGVPPSPQSHTGVFIAEFQKLAGPVLEDVVYPNSDRQGFADDVDARLAPVYTQSLAAADEPVDEHYGVPFGCTFNYSQR
jgi:hypothetical protein